MKKQSKAAQHVFIIAIILLVIIALPVTIKHLFFKQTPGPEQSFEIDNTPANTLQPSPSAWLEPSAPSQTPGSSDGNNPEPEPTASASPEQPQSTGGFITVDKDYFKDALFIGDSRTVGLKQYSSIKEATYFADIGMQSFNVLNKELDVPGKGKTNLENLLKNNSYKKIYLMLGINELGYPSYNNVVAKYSQVLDTIKALCPDAVIYIQANLHVTKSKSDGDSVYNNANIDRLNSAISSLADNKKIFYLDVNVLFDDANHALDPKYSTDGSHVLGKYYMTWGDWLCTQAVAVG